LIETSVVKSRPSVSHRAIFDWLQECKYYFPLSNSFCVLYLHCLAKTSTVVLHKRLSLFCSWTVKRSGWS